jgi:hypothetical protein
MAGIAAEAARTAVCRASSVRLYGPGGARFAVLDHADRAGGVLELVALDRGSASRTLEAGTVPVTAVVTDVSPVPSADRIRAVVRLAGPITVAEDDAAGRALAAGARHRLSEDVPAEALLRDVRLVRLVPTAVRFASSCGCFAPVGSGGEMVDVRRYRAARPDPLALVESEWLGHLVTSHRAELAALGRIATHGDPGARAHTVDRQGLVFRRREAGAAGCRDLRLDFDRRVECLCDATDAWGRLMSRLLPGSAS